MKRKKHVAKEFNINPLFILTKNNLISGDVRRYELNRFAHSHANLLDGCMTDDSWDFLSGMCHLGYCLARVKKLNAMAYSNIYISIIVDMNEVYYRANNKESPNYIGRYVYKSHLIGKVQELINIFAIDLLDATEGDMYNAYQMKNKEYKKTKKGWA